MKVQLQNDAAGPSRSLINRHTHSLIRRLLVMTQTFDPRKFDLIVVPEKAYVTMRLCMIFTYVVYTPETPIEYEPPHFKECRESLPESFGTDHVMGSVSTKV